MKTHEKLIVRALPLLFVAAMFAQSPVVAQAAPVEIQLAQGTNAPASNTATNAPPAKTQLNNPLGSCGIACLVGRAIRIVTGVSGSLALLMFVYGGFTWITAAGSVEKIKKGKQIFITAVTGLIIIFMAYTLVGAVLKAAVGGDLTAN